MVLHIHGYLVFRPGMNDCGIPDPDYNRSEVDAYLSGPLEIPVGAFNLIFTLAGLLFNTFNLFYFFKKQKKDITTFLFICLSAVDLVTILTIGTFETALSFGVFNFYDFATWHFKLFSVLSALFYIETRISIFIVCILSVARCLTIAIPFYKAPSRLIHRALIIYFIFIISLCSFPVFLCGTFSYTVLPLTRIGQMEFGGEFANFFNMNPVLVFNIIMFEIVTMFLPVIPILISSVWTGYNLLFNNESVSSLKLRRKSAVTVLILTIITLICSLPRTMIVTSFLTQEHNIVDKLMELSPRAAYIVTYLAMTGFAIGNAGINPIVLFFRGEKLRKYFEANVVLVIRVKYNTLKKRATMTTINIPPEA